MTEIHESTQKTAKVDDEANRQVMPEAPFRAPEYATGFHRVLFSPWLHGAVLVSIVWLCFARTLTSYFLADDFGEIAYVHRIVNDAPQLLWSNFTGNYMQIPGMAVWRPWLLMTLLFDFLIWKANAYGYYLTNLLYYTGDVLLLYAITRTMTGSWGRARSALIATGGAALFAVNPLHCESISWVVGRVDIVSCFFYLSAFLLVLRSRESASRLPTPLAVVCFWLGLWTKEMAIGLPVLVLALGFLWPGKLSAQTPPTWRERARGAALLSLPFWLSTAVYFALRLLFLHTLVGGYTAGFGASQLSGMVARWTDMDTLGRLFVPLNSYLYQVPNPYQPFILTCYAVLVAVAAVRIISGDLSRRWAIFLLVWCATAAAPIFQLWGLGYNLEGARFYFFLTLPLSLLLPVMTLQPGRPGAERYPKLSARLSVVSTLTIVAMVAVYARVAYASNLVWVHAGKEVRAVSEQSRALARQYQEKTTLAVLGIPKDRGGAHMILNGDTFATMLRPPFVASAVDRRFLTFDPIMFGPSDLVNATRLKACLSSPETKGPFLWQGKAAVWEKQGLEPYPAEGPEIVLPASYAASQWYPHVSGHAAYRAASGAVIMRDLRDGDGLRIDGLNLHPFTSDFLQFEMRAAEDDVELPIRVSWHGTALRNESNASAERIIQPSGASGYRTVRVRLSEYWRWYTQGTVRSLFLRLPRCDEITIRNIKLIPASTVAPRLSVEGAAPTGAGVYPTADGALHLRVDRQLMPAATTVRLEVSSPNFFFDNFPESRQQLAVDHVIDMPSGQEVASLKPSDLPSPGFYQVRARCLDNGGGIVGELSDTITIEKIR